MRDGASSFGLSISHMKLEINLNKPQVVTKNKESLYHSTKKAGFVCLKPKYRMKLLTNEEDQESAETEIKMVVEREGDQVYLDILNGIVKAKKKRSKSLDDIDLSQLSEEIFTRNP